VNGIEQFGAIVGRITSLQLMLGVIVVFKVIVVFRDAVLVAIAVLCCTIGSVVLVKVAFGSVVVTIAALAVMLSLAI
jgi:hypothetical protein